MSWHEALSKAIDTAIGIVSPRTQYQRERYRTASTRAYEGAQTTRLNSGWVTSQLDAAGEVITANPDLRRRARDLVRNNPHAAAAVERQVTNVIGNGIRPRAAIPNSDTTNDAIDVVWENWQAHCDYHGRLSFYGLQSLVERSRFEVGEILIRRRLSRSTGLYDPALRLEVLEVDHLDTSKDVQQLPRGHTIRGGIEYDSTLKPVAYHILEAHPGASGWGKASASNQSTRVPAQDIIHVFEPLRPGQTHGVSCFAPVINEFYELARYQHAERTRKWADSCLTGTVETNDLAGTLAPTETQSDGSGNTERLETFEPGMIQYLSPGERININRPGEYSGYDVYVSTELHKIAAGIGMTYEILTGDLSQVNFSSARAGRQQYYRACRRVQRHVLIPLLCDRVWQWFISSARQAGAIDYASASVPVRWAPQAWESVQPKEDMEAIQLKLAMRLDSWASVVAEATGRDPRDVANEWKKDLPTLEAIQMQVQDAAGSSNAGQQASQQSSNG